MLARPMDILEQFPVRKSKAQKQAFRDAVQSYVSKIGYPCEVEQGQFGSRNLVIGDPETAHYLLTAHYDTPARLPFPNSCAPCSKIHRIWMAMPIVLSSYLLGLVSGLLSALITQNKMMTFWTVLGTIACAFCVGFLFTRMGPANQNNVNDNSSGVITLLEILRTLPENQRSKVCFVLFDLEEMGLIGSKSYRKAHKEATERQLVLNLDCVGDGDQILMIPTKKLRKNQKKLTSLYKACGYFGQKSILVCEKKSAVLMSDHMRFPYAVGIAAFHKHKRFGPYFTRIHTIEDTVLEESNINILRAALSSFICRDAAQ